MGIHRFIKAPKKGNVIKVFDSRDRFVYFGIAQKIKVKTNEQNGVKREVVVVEKTDKTYQLSEVDFFLPESKVILRGNK